MNTDQPKQLDPHLDPAISEQSPNTPKRAAIERRGRLFWTCPRCGTKNPGSAPICSRDGYAIEQEITDTQAALEQTAEQTSCPETINSDPLEDAETVIVPISDQTLPPIIALADDPLTEETRVINPPIHFEHQPRRSKKWAGFLIASLALLAIPLATVWISHEPVTTAEIETVREPVEIIEHKTESNPPSDQAVLPVEENHHQNAVLGDAFERTEQELSQEVIEEIYPDTATAAEIKTPSEPAEPEVTEATELSEVQPLESDTPGGLTALADGLEAQRKANAKAMKKEVQALLKAHGYGGVSVSVNSRNVVTLKGAFSDPDTKDVVLALVRNHDGVSQVKDKLFLYD